jgi:hypothetical protein
MKLKLKRIFKGDKYTIGHLYINNIYFCDTLEDKVRNLPKEPKVYGETAIPAGTYEIDMNTISPKFRNRAWAKKWGGIVPRLKNVPYFDGVLIHVGNNKDDTDGCIIVGDNQIVGGVVNSAIQFNRLMPRLIDANKRGESITIEII